MGEEENVMVAVVAGLGFCVILTPLFPNIDPIGVLLQLDERQTDDVSKNSEGRATKIKIA